MVWMFGGLGGLGARGLMGIVVQLETFTQHMAGTTGTQYGQCVGGDRHVQSCTLCVCRMCVCVVYVREIRFTRVVAVCS